MADLTSLTTLILNLEKNSISEESCQQIMRGLSQLKNLTELQLLLKTNHIQTYGLSQLGSLKRLRSLHLDIFNNQIGDKGIGTVGLQLQKLNDIRKLKLDAGMNNIREGFVMILGTVLSQMKRIVELEFSFEYNPMDDEPSIAKVEWPLKNLARTSPLQDLKIHFGHANASGDVFTLVSGIIGCFQQLRNLEVSVVHNFINEYHTLGRALCELKLLKTLRLDF